MATDLRLVLGNLTAFYDFRDKSILHVGAGGGQLVGYATQTRRVIAIDPDPEAVVKLQAAISVLRLGDRFSVRHAEFERVHEAADVVFFEFCLHEIADPEAALAHGRALAPEILVIDHAPGSRWCWHCAETDKVARSWAAVEQAGIRREQRFEGWQRFGDAAALVQRLESLGEPAIGRARALEGIAPIEIEMAYRVALI